MDDTVRNKSGRWALLRIQRRPRKYSVEVEEDCVAEDVLDDDDNGHEIEYDLDDPDAGRDTLIQLLNAIGSIGMVFGVKHRRKLRHPCISYYNDRLHL